MAGSKASTIDKTALLYFSVSYSFHYMKITH